MKYQVTHNTVYEYGEPVPVCQNLVHLAPRHSRYQNCSYHRLIVRPKPLSTGKRLDYFGNMANFFSVTTGHVKLSVTALSKVDVRPRPDIAPGTTAPWESVRDTLPHDHSRSGLDTYQFCFGSLHVLRAPELAEYARPSFAPQRPIVDAVLDLTSRIHAEFTYDPSATTVHTPIREVFQNRRGVCQDLAHLEIGCLRSLGLAARYVSGYLRTRPPEGKPRLVGADASHAWLSIYCGPLGWVDADPTNNVSPSTNHITVAWGRDYGDVCPIRGMYVGGGKHSLTVSVDVKPLDEPPP